MTSSRKLCPFTTYFSAKLEKKIENLLKMCKKTVFIKTIMSFTTHTLCRSCININKQMLIEGITKRLQKPLECKIITGVTQISKEETER